jgi:16S rRNA (cytidine1402-2'-O)-methyltransferase
MVEAWGGSRQIAVCRELSKLHEEIWRGTVAGAAEEWANRPPRGEFTLVIAGAEAVVDTWDTARVEAALRTALTAGATAKDAVRTVTDQSGWPKRDVYTLIHKIES